VQSRSELALIVGAGSGLSASLARKCAAAGMRIALAARHVGKLDPLVAETHARAIACDAADPAQVEALFAAVDPPDLVVYNPSYRVRGPFLELAREEVQRTLIVSAYGGFLVAQAALKRMVERGRGALFFTGASASVKGYAESAPFAMGKFALRGLAQSLAREFGPKNIHVAHFVIDGGIERAGGAQEDIRRAAARGADGMLRPDAIAETYLAVYRQHRSAWAFEVDLRPWVEKF
jgi:NAD(P)-dependent dehydrogenase (short-subunit alcohol dehydrogenase family)